MACTPDPCDITICIWYKKTRIYLWLEHSCSGRSKITEDIVTLLRLQQVLHLLHQSYILWKLNCSCPNIRSPWGPYEWWVFDNGATEQQPHKYHRILISPEQDGLRLNRYKAYKVEVINWSVLKPNLLFSETRRQSFIHKLQHMHLKECKRYKFWSVQHKYME